MSSLNSHLSGSVSKNNENGRKAQKCSICKNCQEVFLNKILYRLHTVIDCARNRQKKKQNSKETELREEGHVDEAKRADENQKIVDIEKKETRGSSEGFPSRRKPPRAKPNKMRFNTRSQSKKDENKSSNGGASHLIVETSRSPVSIRDQLAIMEDVHGKVTMKDEESKESKMEVMADDKKKESRSTLPGKKNRKGRKNKSKESDFDENFNIEENNSDLDSPIVKKKKVVVSRIVDKNNSSLKSPTVPQKTDNFDSSNVEAKMKDLSKLSATISSLPEKQVPEGSSCNSFPKSVRDVTDGPCENRVDQVKSVSSSKSRLIESLQSGETNVQSESPTINDTNAVANDTAEINEIEGHSIQSGILIEDVDTCGQSDSSVIVTLGELLNEANKDTNINVEGGNTGLEVMPSSLGICRVAPAIEKAKQKIEPDENESEMKAGREREVEASENVEVLASKERLKENDKQKKKRCKRAKKEWEMRRINEKRVLVSSSSDSGVLDKHTEKLIKKNESNLKLQPTKVVNRRKSPRKDPLKVNMIACHDFESKLKNNKVDSEKDDINTEEEGDAFIDETNTNRRALDFLANNAKTVHKTPSSERICLLTELANTEDVNTDGTDLDRDNMESDIGVRIGRSHEDDRMCPTESIPNIFSLNEKRKNKQNPKTSSSKRICLPSQWFNTEVVDDNGLDTDGDKISDIIDERTPGDVRICPTKFSNNVSSNEYQPSKPIPKMSSSDKIYLKNSNENYGTLDLDFENRQRDIFDIIEDRAFKDKQIPSSSNVSSNSLPKEYQGPVEEQIFMEVDNGDLENGQTIHDGSLTSMLPSELDAEVASVSTPSLLGCSKSSKNHVEFSNDDEDVEKQIELVPKIKIKRNLIQWAFEFDSDSILTPPRKTSKRLNVSSYNQSIENQVEESPKKTAKQWKPYSKEEDGNIVRYMKENNMTGRQRGRRNWQQMEEENVCPGRTWQSMKERWIKHIERKLINIASENENE